MGPSQRDISVCFPKLSIDLIEPASFEEPVKNVGRFPFGLNLLGLGEEDLVDCLPRDDVLSGVQDIKRISGASLTGERAVV